MFLVRWKFSRLRCKQGCKNKKLLNTKLNFRFFADAKLYFLLSRKQGQHFNNFENDIMRLSIDQAKLTRVCELRNCAAIQQVLISKFAFRPKKFPDLCEKCWPPESNVCKLFVAIPDNSNSWWVKPLSYFP